MLIPFGVFSAAGAGGGAVAGSYELISSTILGSTTASVTFDVTGLGSTYKHLQIRFAARGDGAGTALNTFMRFNADSGSNYAWHYLQGAAGSVSSGAVTATNKSIAGRITASSGTANAFGATVLDLLDVFSTAKNKTLRMLMGDTTANAVTLCSGVWLSTSAATSIVLLPETGNFVSGSRFSIYGIRG